MPIFRKGRISKKQEALLGKEIHREYGPRQYKERAPWLIEETPFAKIKQIFAPIFLPIGGGKSFIDEMFEIKGNKPVVVLDWGCGGGRTAGEVAKEFGEKVKVYGFANESYRQWAEIPNVKFIHATKEDLPRYLKNGSVDLIYSHAGLSNLVERGELAKHLSDLMPKLPKGGKIVFTLSTTSFNVVGEVQKALAGKASVAVIGNLLFISKIVP